MCGICSIISQEPTKFNINHFNILGTLNDERGGDSCGYFIDGTVNKGVADLAYFRYFTTKQKYPKYVSIALIHCRKTSPGYVSNLEQAQPVVIEEDGKCKFVLMHNGTITNIRALATKYVPDFDTLGLSDSQILAQIIYKSGFKVLEEYEGAAALIMADYRDKKPKVFVFKGSSCYNEVNETCERPLYYAKIEDKIYISSMYYSLYCCDYTKPIYNVPVNALCEVKNNTLKPIYLIDRSKIKRSPIVNVYSYCNEYKNLNSYYDDDDEDVWVPRNPVPLKLPIKQTVTHARLITYNPSTHLYQLGYDGSKG